MPKSYEAPFDAEGNLQHYPHNWTPVAEWREVKPFTAGIQCIEVLSGRSAKYTLWRDRKDRTYPMFVTDLVNLIQTVTVTPAWNVNTWIVCKRGENYGIRLATEKEVREFSHA